MQAGQSHGGVKDAPDTTQRALPAFAGTTYAELVRYVWKHHSDPSAFARQVERLKSMAAKSIPCGETATWELKFVITNQVIPLRIINPEEPPQLKAAPPDFNMYKPSPPRFDPNKEESVTIPIEGRKGCGLP